MKMEEALTGSNAHLTKPEYNRLEFTSSKKGDKGSSKYEIYTFSNILGAKICWHIGLLTNCLT